MAKECMHTVFWGSSEFSVYFLDHLERKYQLVPQVIVTTPDKPAGRKQIMTPSPAKMWAAERGIPFITPKKLKDEDVASQIKKILEDDPTHGSHPTWDFSLVASYGKIIPGDLLNIPRHGTFNIHPSLLPDLRGPSPIQTAILEKDKTGVTMIELDEEIDHGPIVSQKEIALEPWPDEYDVIEKKLAEKGADMFAHTLPSIFDGSSSHDEQDHDKATFTKMINKEDGEINLNDNAETNYRKYLAYKRWPGTFFFEDRRRIKITQAHLSNRSFVIDKVIPEGKKEVSYSAIS